MKRARVTLCKSESEKTRTRFLLDGGWNSGCMKGGWGFLRGGYERGRYEAACSVWVYKSSRWPVPVKSCNEQASISLSNVPSIAFH